MDLFHESIHYIEEPYGDDVRLRIQKKRREIESFFPTEQEKKDNLYSFCLMLFYDMLTQ
jgi:hypothetical protein